MDMMFIMNRFNKLTSITSGFLTLAVSHSVYAAPTPVPIETESGIAIVPYLNLYSGYNSNVAKEEFDETSSWFAVYEPGVGFELESDKQKHNLGYRIQRGEFFSSQRDNYTDHFLDLTSYWEANSRNALDLRYSLAKTHENRGDNDTTSNLDYNKYVSNSFNLGYRYGSTEAKGQIEANVGWGDLSYKNNRNVTRYQDWDEGRFSTAFFYKAFPKTSLLAQYIVNDRSYNEVAPGSSERDSLHHFVYLGTSWDATGKLRGSVKIGYQNKEFDASQREDFDSFSWDVDVAYMLRSYSALELKSSRKSTDPNGLGGAIDTSVYNANWSHNWSEIISTHTELSYLSEDYTDSSRKDDTSKASVYLDYDFRRWLTFKGGVSYEFRDSNLSNFSYDQSVYYVAVEGVM